MNTSWQVVATIGAFGDYETMKRFNGDANIVVAEEAAAAGCAIYLAASVHKIVFA